VFMSCVSLLYLW